MPVNHTLTPSIYHYNNLCREVDSRKIGSRFTNFTLEYKDVYDFAIIRGLQISNLTTDELTRLVTKISEMQEVAIHSLNTKHREIKRLSLVNARLVKNTTNDYFYYYRYSVHGCYDIS